MNSYGRRVLQMVAIGGTIATGIALNTNDVMAAELDDSDVPAEVGEKDTDVVDDSISAEQVQADYSAEEVQDESLQSMEDAVGVIEGCAAAEDILIDEANEKVSNEDMSLKTVEDIAANGVAVCEQAINKNEQVKSTYEDISNKTEAAEADFCQQESANCNSDYSEKLASATNTEEKIAIIEDAKAKLEAEYAEYNEKYGTESEEYKNLVAEIEAANAALAEAESELAKAENAYDLVSDTEEFENKRTEVSEKDQEYSEKIAELETDINLRPYRFPYMAVTNDAEASKNYGESIAEIESQISESDKLQKEYLAKLEEREDKELREKYNKEVERYNALNVTVEEYKSAKEKLDVKVKAAEAETEKLYEEYLTYEPKLNALKEEVTEWHKEDEYAVYSDQRDTADILVSYEEKINTAKATIVTERDRLTTAENKKAEIDKNLYGYRSIINAADTYQKNLKTLEAAEDIKARSESSLDKAKAGFRQLNVIIGTEAIKLLEDATNATADDALIESECLKTAREAAANGKLSEDIAANILTNAKSILEHAQKNNDEVKSFCGKMSLQVNGSEKTFVDAAKAKGMTEVVDNHQKAEDKKEKLEVVNEAINKVDAEYEEYMQQHGSESEEYKEISNAIAQSEGATYAAAKSAVRTVVAQEVDSATLAKYNELSVVRDAYQDELDSIAAVRDEYSAQMAECEQAIYSENAKIVSLKAQLADYERQAEESLALQEELLAKANNGDEEAATLYQAEFERYVNEIVDAKTDIEWEITQAENAIEYNRLMNNTYVDCFNYYSNEYAVKMAEFEEWKKSVSFDELEAMVLAQTPTNELTDVDKKGTAADGSEMQNNVDVEELKAKKAEIDSAIQEKTDAHDSFVLAATIYKECLEYAIKIEDLTNRSARSLATADNAFDKLQQLV